MKGIKLNNKQQALLKLVSELVMCYKPKHYSPFSSTFSYLSDKFSRYFLNKKGTAHEASLLVTEDTRVHCINCSLSFEDLVKVFTVLDNEFYENSNPSLFYKLYLDLTKLIADQAQGNAPVRQESIFHPENNIFPDASGNNTFNPQVLKDYVNFTLCYLNNSNLSTLCTEAQKILDSTALLTPQFVLLRGLARAVLFTANVNGYNFQLSNPDEQLKIEYCTASSLFLTAITRDNRESILSDLQEEFAILHPYITKFMRLTHIVNENDKALSFGYVVGILSVFTVRLYSQYAVERAQQDVLFFTQANKTISYNRTGYTDYRNNKQNYTNNTMDSILAPEHSSEYFPEMFGIFNGTPGIITTVISVVQLFCALPAFLCSEVKKQFILGRLSKNKLTTLETRENHHLMASLLFRWIGNVAMQPTDMVTSPFKDLALNYTIFRFFLPSSYIEEPLKYQSVANTFASSSYRKKKRVSVSFPAIYSTTLLTLGLEYGSVCFNLQYVIVILKLLRPLSLILVLHSNRSNTLYSNNTQKFTYASLSRLSSSILVLPMFDLLGDKLRYLSLATGIDVVLSVQSDVTCSIIMCEVSNMQVNTAVIQDILDSSMSSNNNYFLVMPIAERARLQHKQNMTVTQMLELFYKELDIIEQQSNASPSIVEVTDEEAEQVLQAQAINHKSQRIQRRSDLNLPLQHKCISFTENDDASSSTKSSKFKVKPKHKSRIQQQL